jgi:hypothetical protein
MPSSTPKPLVSNLQTLLKSSTSRKVHECLLQTITTASVAEQEALSALLAPLAADAGLKKHCVRCHVTYTENKNHSTACKIEHGEGDGERTEVGDDAITMTLYCCGATFDSEDQPDQEFCILALHTTNVDDVVYYDSDDDAGEEWVNQNVVSCKSRGCSKKRKAAKEGGENGGLGGKKRKSA